MVLHNGKEKFTKVTVGYGVTWVLDVISITHFSANIVNGGITLPNETGESVDIS